MDVGGISSSQVSSEAQVKVLNKARKSEEEVAEKLIESSEVKARDEDKGNKVDVIA